VEARLIGLRNPLGAAKNADPGKKKFNRCPVAPTFREIKPFGEPSKGFLVVGTRVTPSGRQFKQTVLRIRRLGVCASAAAAEADAALMDGYRAV